MEKTESEKIEQQNEIIARFMGAYDGNPVDDKKVLCGVPDFFSTRTTSTHLVKDLLYHKRWDWLMQVVQKIVNADMDTFDSYALWVSDSLRTADIKQVYYAVCQYIENTTQPSPQNQEK